MDIHQWNLELVDSYSHVEVVPVIIEYYDIFIRSVVISTVQWSWRG